MDPPAVDQVVDLWCITEDFGGMRRTNCRRLAEGWWMMEHSKLLAKAWTPAYWMAPPLPPVP